MKERIIELLNENTSLTIMEINDKLLLNTIDRTVSFHWGR